MTNDITQSHCNRCGRLTNHYLIGEDRQEYSPRTENWDDVHQMLKCCGCDAISMRNIVKGYGDEPIIVYYPPSVARRAPQWVYGFSKDIPQSVYEIMKEVYSAVQNDSLRLAAMGVRAALENVMIEKVGDFGSFRANVDEFQKHNYISTRQALTLGSILEAGHASTHRRWRPTRKDIDILLDIAEGVIETVYVHEQRAQELDKVVPRRQRPKKPEK